LKERKKNRKYSVHGVELLDKEMFVVVCNFFKIKPLIKKRKKNKDNEQLYLREVDIT